MFGGDSAGFVSAIGAAKVGTEAMLIENQGSYGGFAAFIIEMCMNQIRPNKKSPEFVLELLL